MFLPCVIYEMRDTKRSWREKQPAQKKKKNHIDGSKFNSALYGIYNYAFHTLIRLLKY